MNWSPVVRVTLSLILNGSSPIVDSMLFDYHMLVLGFRVVAISDKMYARKGSLCLYLNGTNLDACLLYDACREILPCNRFRS